MGVVSLLLLLAADAVRVLDPDGRPVRDAVVQLSTPTGTIAERHVTGASGEFPRPASTNLIVDIEATGFARFRGPLAEEVRLSLAPLNTTLNVTVRPGTVESDSEAMAESRPVRGPHVGSVLAGAPGILLQQTGPSQMSPFLRGLTGYQVLNLVDGVRFNNSTFRSGPNQYLAFLEPSQADRIESVLGPTSVQYGSDALGGTLQVFTPPLGGLNGWHGEWATQASSADLSAGTSAKASYGGARHSVLFGLSGRKHNDLRAGGGTDSRHALRRYLDLPPDQIRRITGNRQQDTGYTQHGLHAKFLTRLSASQWLTAWYQRSRQDDVRVTKDLWGGLGRMQSTLEPQGLDLGYLRWEKLALPGLDVAHATLSFNSQGDGSVRQGLRATDAITLDRSRVNSLGIAAQASTRWTARHQLVFGGERYQEQISATRTVAGVPARPLYPDASRYRTGGLFAQERLTLGRFRASGGLRWTRASYRTVATPRFGVAASEQTFGDVTFNGGLAWQANQHLGFHALVGRGFRAPNANDLGAVGLNDLGYEVPSAQGVAAGALLGASAGETALSLGRPVATLGPERIFNYEAGLRVQTSRVYFRTQLFLSDLYDPIVRRTLLFPLGAIPSAVGGLPVVAIAPSAAQRAQGVTTVATSIDPRALKSFVNDGRTRYYGPEASARVQLTDRWHLDASYAFLVGRDLLPNRNVRRLPPQQGWLRLRYQRSRWWASAWSESNGAQRRLSGGDVDDERIGASRSRNDIQSFLAGSRLGGVSPTGESLAQVLDRVLPGQAAGVRVPLYASTAGWLTANLGAGVNLTERLDADFVLSNLLDRNYRVHGSGFDAPGFNASLGLRWRF